MTPEVVVFDLGKVLVDFNYAIAADKLAARSSMLPEQITRFIDQSPLLFRYETGLLTRQQFYDEVRATTGFCGDVEEFAMTFGDIFTPSEPMIQLANALREAGYPLYIFSNTNDMAIAHIRRAFPFFSHFDGYIFSYEHGAMKPDPRIYEAVERECGRSGAEILYLDDRQENVAGGAARGWQVILHESPEKTCAAIQSLRMLQKG